MSKLNSTTKLPNGTKRYFYNTRKFGSIDNAVRAAVADGFEEDYARENLIITQVVLGGRWTNEKSSC